MYQLQGEPEELALTPVSLYNQVVEQYNDPINIQNAVYLDKAYQDSLYRFWFSIQKAYKVVLILVYLLPYLNFISMFCNLYLVIINELAIIKFNRNRSRVPDPLSNMIYEPSLCTRSRYMYYEVDRAELKVFNFGRHSEEKILKLKENNDCKIVRFMVYDRNFIAGYYSTVEYRLSSFMHLILSLIFLVIVYYFLYSQNTCFSLLSPFESFRKCFLNPPNQELV